MKYYEATLKIRDGEHEYTQDVFVEQPTKRKAKAHIMRYCRNFYDGIRPEYDKEDESFWFPGACVIVQPRWITETTKEAFTEYLFNKCRI